MMKKRLLMILLPLFVLTGCVEEKDPCEDVLCLNAGVCLDGECDCPEGYFGTRCQLLEPCFGVNCLNGGVCVSGSCDCPPGFSGDRCQTKDPCYGVTCLNNGTCNNGKCDCTERWTGTDCGTQKTPDFIIVRAINVIGFPPTKPTGGGWDGSSGADIYPAIGADGDNFKYVDFDGSHILDADPTKSYRFEIPGNGFIIPTYGKTYSVSLYDDDSFANDEFMGGVLSKFYFPTNKFPARVVFDAGLGYRFEMEMEYVFQ